MHMSHGLVGTDKTSLNVITISTSVKQQHYHSMFSSMKQSHMASKIIKDDNYKSVAYAIEGMSK